MLWQTRKCITGCKSGRNFIQAISGLLVSVLIEDRCKTYRYVKMRYYVFRSSTNFFQQTLALPKFPTDPAVEYPFWICTENFNLKNITIPYKNSKFDFTQNKTNPFNIFGIVEYGLNKPWTHIEAVNYRKFAYHENIQPSFEYIRKKIHTWQKHISIPDTIKSAHKACNKVQRDISKFAKFRADAPRRRKNAQKAIRQFQWLDNHWLAGVTNLSRECDRTKRWIIRNYPQWLIFRTICNRANNAARSA